MKFKFCTSRTLFSFLLTKKAQGVPNAHMYTVHNTYFDFVNRGRDPWFAKMYGHLRFVMETAKLSPK